MLPEGATRRRYGTGSVLPAATAGAYEGSVGIRAAGSRSLFIRRRHHDRGRRDITREGGSGTLSRELAARGIYLNPGKTGTLAPKGHVPTPEAISLLAGVGVLIVEHGWIKVVGVPVGSDEFATESACLLYTSDAADE